MDELLIAFAIAVPLAFIAGVVFNKYVLSEAASIRQHVTDTETRIKSTIENGLADVRKDTGILLLKAGSDVEKVATKV